MFISMLALMATGLPIAFSLGGVGVMAGLLLWGPSSLELLYFSAMEVMRNWVLIAVPLFIFMGYVLHESDIAKDLFDAVLLWAGGVKGALGMGTVAICAVIAAMVGISGAATLSMGVIALPAMLNRNYDKHIAVGLIQAGGALGFLIPPSMMMIMYGFLSGVSVGQLFAGGVLPGLMLAGMYIAYIGVRCQIQPHMGPALPVAERGTFNQKIAAIRVLLLPALLIFFVMGCIFSGITSPTEAAGVGAVGALICAALRRKLTWDLIKKATLPTLELSGFTAWIIIGAVVFSKVYTGLGATAMIKSYMVGLDVNPWFILIVMQLSFFFFGMFMDDIAILFMCMPIYIPIITGLGFDPVWFAILYIVNMQMAFLTPPYGVNLFYMKAVVPKDVTMGDIYMSVIPFVILQLVGLILLMLFPQIILWLPTMLFR
ncbi:MAG TPA: TRAP transporter large permease subunit [Desulfobacteraceae bacterium]|nr:TRAP transporter large permease subunit [Desulfobacteraceae bacterium]